jgi:hypothetical protein
VRNPEPLLECPIPSKLAYTRQPSADSESMAESQSSSSNSQDVDNIMVALGLLRPRLTLSQMSASPKKANRRRDVGSPNNAVGVRNGRSSPSLQDYSAQACGVDRYDATPSSSETHGFSKRNYGGLPLSPSISRFTSKTGSDKAQRAAQLPFACGSFVDDDVDEKRTRGFSNLFKMKSASKASGKSKKATETTNSMQS